MRAPHALPEQVFFGGGGERFIFLHRIWAAPHSPPGLRKVILGLSSVSSGWPAASGSPAFFLQEDFSPPTELGREEI